MAKRLSAGSSDGPLGTAHDFITPSIPTGNHSGGGLHRASGRRSACHRQTDISAPASVPESCLTFACVGRWIANSLVRSSTGPSSCFGGPALCPRHRPFLRSPALFQRLHHVDHRRQLTFRHYWKFLPFGSRMKKPIKLGLVLVTVFFGLEMRSKVTNQLFR